MARWRAASSPCHGSLGRNLLVEWRFADGDVNRLPALVGELVQARVDLRRRRRRRPGHPGGQAGDDDDPDRDVRQLRSDRARPGLRSRGPGGNITGILIAPDGTLADWGIEHRIIMFYPQRFGFLMTMNYWADFDEPFRMGASYVDRTLRGTRPADLPVEQVSTFRLVINACAAKAMGLTTPRDLLARADEVIE